MNYNHSPCGLQEPRRKITPPGHPDAVRVRKECLPYGQWLISTGKAIMFNFYHRPLIVRGADGVLRVSNSDERPADIIEYETIYFYDESMTEREKTREASMSLKI